MRQMIEARERLQREQNESLREQLSMQYSQRLREEQTTQQPGASAGKENENLASQHQY